MQGLQKITTPELSEELPSSRTLVELDVYSNANGGFHNFKQIIDNWITGDQVSVRYQDFLKKKLDIPKVAGVATL